MTDTVMPDSYLPSLASDYYQPDDFTPVTFEQATAGLTTTEAWVQVAVNGLLANKDMDKAVNQLADKCTLNEPVEAMAKQLLSSLDAVVATWLGVADEPLNEVDRKALLGQYTKGGIAAVLVGMLNDDNDWPSDDTQRENRHDY